MSVATVASAQIACVPGNIEANLAAHLAAIREARDRHVDLLVFPELSLTDYESEPDTAGLARPPDGPDLVTLAEAGRGMVLVVGFMAHRDEGAPFNACAVLEGGRVVHVHAKLNLPTYGGLREGHHYTAGRRIETAEIGLGRLAALICADTWNPALPWLAALAGADILAVPIASAEGAVADTFDSRANWDLNLRHTAMTYGIPIVMTNHCETRGALRFWGGSTIVDAFGRVLAQAGAGPELLVAQIDPEDGRVARARLPTMRDAAPDLVAAELDRLLRTRLVL